METCKSIRCQSTSPITGEQCVMNENHFGPHCIGDLYNPVERWVTKCENNKCDYHHNSNESQKWLECIHCGDKKDIAEENRPEPKEECIYEEDKKIDKCKGILGKIFGHNFKARYNTEYSEGKFPPDLDLWSPYCKDIIEATKSEKSEYIHDICIRCGKVIKKKEPDEEKI